jgi:hypothetical protein
LGGMTEANIIHVLSFLKDKEIAVFSSVRIILFYFSSDLRVFCYFPRGFILHLDLQGKFQIVQEQPNMETARAAKMGDGQPCCPYFKLL